MSRDVVEAYLAGQAGAFLPTPWRTREARTALVRRVSRALTPAIGEALAAQQARLSPSPARDIHLAALRAGAAAVVTGQQVGLFLGPLYTLYKAASAIRAARAMSDESGQPVVPVFWLQSEDHDLPEIASCGLPGDGEPVLVSLPASPEDRVSVAHRLLPDGVEACLAELRASLGGQLHATELLDLLARHYRPGRGWVASFAGLLDELFAPEGLVILDPRDPALAEAARPVHERALAEGERISAALVARTVALAKAGFVAPVHVRSAAPLSFFHPEGPEGPRYRLEPVAGGRFRVIGAPGVYTLADLRAALAEDPRVFSTSALLRPILQDTWLPTAAYVGGPGEIAYFTQISPLYEIFDRPMPAVLLRARFRLLEPRTRKLLARLGLNPADAGLPESEILARGTRTDDVDAIARLLQARFDAALAEVAPALSATGKDGDRTLLETRESVGRRIAKLAARHQHALLRRDGERVAAVRRLKELLLPGGAPQERQLGLPYFAARTGTRALVERVLAAVVPFESHPQGHHAVSHDLDVLAFGPHPDDVELFCGGALIRFADLGHATGIVDLSRGERATHGTAAERAGEAAAAATIMNCRVRENLGLPDTGLDASSVAQIRAVVEAIRRLRPELVLAPWPCGEERHPDHLATGLLVEKAVFFAGLGKYEADHAPFRPRALLQYQMRHAMPASFVMDTSAAADRKQKAIRCHASQIGQLGTLVGAPDLLAALDARDRYTGSLIGTSHGEAFRAPAMLSVKDPLQHLRDNGFAAPHAFQPVPR